MRLEQRSFAGGTCFAALLVTAAAASVGCKSSRVDRDGLTEHSFDYTSGATDKSGAADPGAPGNGDRVGTTTVTGADLGALSSELAVERIVAARCARETACNNVGADKHFVDHDACARSVRSKLADDLKPSECPRGVDADAVDRCMEATRSESCNNPVDTISRLAACRTSDLCLKDPASKR